jgi:hypothetical protein
LIESDLHRIEETIRLCEDAIVRLELHGDRSADMLLEEMKKLRADKLREVARLREQAPT